MSASLVWFRRDLRADDHAALSLALRTSRRVWCVFVFDTEILDRLPSRADRRVAFIHASVVELDAALARRSRAAGGPAAGLIVRHGRARELIPALARELGVSTVFANRDYEPAAIARDRAVAAALAAGGIGFEDGKDQVIFERDEVLTREGAPFAVFTPYRKAWMRQLTEQDLMAHPVAAHAAALAAKPAGESVPALRDLGFVPTNLAELKFPTGACGARRLLDGFLARIDRYHVDRDYPARPGVSFLSTHLRFGTVSVRELARLARGRAGDGARTWLSELIWRDFYQMILWQRPHVVDQPFKPEARAVQWDHWPEGFQAWCEARTGYPLIDAAMRQLLRTGYMHNRLRMLVASFLTKDLGIDWRAGERFFANHLIDYDLAANNGGWQWAASTGCDAQPWFRIFNPVTQSERFDPGGRFIRRFVPELAGLPDDAIHAPSQANASILAAAGVRLGETYPPPIVDHAQARQRTLARFGVIAKPRRIAAHS